MRHLDGLCYGVNTNLCYNKIFSPNHHYSTDSTVLKRSAHVAFELAALTDRMMSKNMKKSTLKLISVPAVALLALVGCGKENRKDGDVVVAEPVVQQLDAVCEDPALKVRLDVAIKDAILSAAMNQMVGLEPEQALSIQNAFGQQLNNVRIDTQNATNFADSCMVDVLITPNPEDMVAAEFAFAKSGATLLQRASQDQVELNNGTIIAKQVTYQMVNGDIVMYASNHNAIRLVADILVASADTLPEMTSMTGATRPQVIERQIETVPTEIDGTQSATPIQRAPTVTTRIERPSTSSQATNNNASSTRSQSTITQERQTVRTVTPSSNASSTNVPAASAPANRAADDQARPASPSTPSHEEAAPAPAASDTESSITIVESNETY